MPVALDCSTEEGLEQWVRWMEANRSLRLVAEDQIGPYWVSTVFLGLDEQWSQGSPNIFETMIFERDESTCLLTDESIELIAHTKSDLHHLRWRYPTWEAAEQGHRNLTGMVRRTLRKGSEWWAFVNRIVKSKPIYR